MKTIYTLAIALMAGVILTACVGAINIGGISPETALINRCIIGNTAQRDPTCAKAVADTNGCITNPFLSGCEANPLFSPHVQNARDERVKFCNDANNEEDSLCTGSDSEKDICTHDPFSVICNHAYYNARKSACEDTLTFPRCTDTVILACDADPFNTDLCFQDNTYNDDRESQCRLRTNRNRCAPTVKRVCDADPFNITLCFSGDIYDSLRETTCANEPTSTRCATTISRVCSRNAFHGLCTDNPVYEHLRISDCIIAGNAGESRCTESFAEDSCVLNPFGASCDIIEDSCVLHPYRAGCNISYARKLRVSFCSDDTTESNLCTQSIRDCLLNPFDKSCNDDSFENTRLGRITFCRDSQNLDNSLCSVVSPCLMNPFGAGCGLDDFDNFRTERITFCGVRANLEHDDCEVTFSRVTAASWLQSFTTELPASAGGNRFVQGTEDGLDVGNTRGIQVGRKRTSKILTLDSIFEDGNTTSGLAFIWGQLNYRENGQFAIGNYVGILQGTDLGLPLNETITMAEWNGKFYIYHFDNFMLNENFTLTVNFDTEENAGTVETRVNSSDGNYYSLTGDFDSNGVISGDVNYIFGGNTIFSGTVYSGEFTGLIGQEGAIGAFAGNSSNNRRRYTGGFVAKPPAK